MRVFDEIRKELCRAGGYTSSSAGGGIEETGPARRRPDGGETSGGVPEVPSGAAARSDEAEEKEAGMRAFKDGTLRIPFPRRWSRWEWTFEATVIVIDMQSGSVSPSSPARGRVGGGRGVVLL
jgi:hypothetical protein